MKRLFVLALLPLLGLFVTPVYAITAPTSITLSNVKVFRNLAVPGDMLVVFHSDMPYASDNYSTTPASESTELRLTDSDNTTILISGTPYVNPFFASNGYGDGVGSFYLGSDNATALWGDPVTISIRGFPVFYSMVKSYTLTPSDYVTATTQETNQALLKTYILLECDKLASAYSSTGIVLKSTSDIGVVLSPYGELYFRGVIQGLQNLCPELFFIQTVIPEQMDVVPYDMSLGETYKHRLDTDDLGAGFTHMGTLTGLGVGFPAVAWVIFSLWVCVWTHKKGWGMEPGLATSTLVGICLALLVGDIVFAIIMIVSMLAVIGIVWLLLLKRA